MCSEHLSARLRISKIIRGSKQRGGWLEAPSLFDLASHMAASAWTWEQRHGKGALEAGLVGDRFPHCCITAHGEVQSLAGF